MSRPVNRKIMMITEKIVTHHLPRINEGLGRCQSQTLTSTGVLGCSRRVFDAREESHRTDRAELSLRVSSTARPHLRRPQRPAEKGVGGRLRVAMKVLRLARLMQDGDARNVH